METGSSPLVSPCLNNEHYAYISCHVHSISTNSFSISCVCACVCVVAGKTALHWAASMNMVGIMRILQKHGANKDAQDNQVRPEGISVHHRISPCPFILFCVLSPTTCHVSCVMCCIDRVGVV